MTPEEDRENLTHQFDKMIETGDTLVLIAAAMGAAARQHRRKYDKDIALQNALADAQIMSAAFICEMFALTEHDRAASDLSKLLQTRVAEYQRIQGVTIN